MVTTKIHPDLKRDWLAALRNPLFKQGIGALQRNGKSCCLDILCQLLTEPLGLDVSWDIDSKSYNGQRSILPTAVQRFTGLTDNTKYGSYCEGNLVTQNDTHHLSFAEIANIIEREF